MALARTAISVASKVYSPSSLCSGLVLALKNAVYDESTISCHSLDLDINSWRTGKSITVPHLNIGYGEKHVVLQGVLYVWNCNF